MGTGLKRVVHLSPKAAKAYRGARARQKREPDRKIIWHRNFPIEKVPGGGYFATVYLVDLYGGIEALSLSEAKSVVDEAIEDGTSSTARAHDASRRGRRARRNPSGGYTAKQIAWTIGITALTAATGAIVIWYVNRKLPEKLPPKPALDINVSGSLADQAKAAADKAAADLKAFLERGGTWGLTPETGKT